MSDGILHPLDGDGVNPTLLYSLAKPNKNLEGASLHITPTVVFENGVGKALFYSASPSVITAITKEKTEQEESSKSRKGRKEVKKRTGKDLDLQELYVSWTKDRGSQELAASFISTNRGFHLADESDKKGPAIQFMSCKQLKDWLFTNHRKPNGILQKFMPPKGNNNITVQAIWSPRVTLCEARRNRNDVNDVRTPLFDRAFTFEVPESGDEDSSQITPVAVTPQVQMTIQNVCESIVSHLILTEHIQLTRMMLFFKSDARGYLRLLYSTSMRLVKKLRKDQLPGAAPMTGSPLNLSVRLARRRTSAQQEREVEDQRKLGWFEATKESELPPLLDPITQRAVGTVDPVTAMTALLAHETTSALIDTSPDLIDRATAKMNNVKLFPTLYNEKHGVEQLRKKPDALKVVAKAKREAPRPWEQPKQLGAESAEKFMKEKIRLRQKERQKELRKKMATVTAPKPVDDGGEKARLLEEARRVAEAAKDEKKQRVQELIELRKKKKDSDLAKREAMIEKKQQDKERREREKQEKEALEKKASETRRVQIKKEQDVRRKTLDEKQRKAIEAEQKAAMAREAEEERKRELAKQIAQERAEKEKAALEMVEKKWKEKEEEMERKIQRAEADQERRRSNARKSLASISLLPSNPSTPTMSKGSVQKDEPQSDFGSSIGKGERMGQRANRPPSPDSEKEKEDSILPLPPVGRDEVWRAMLEDGTADDQYSPTKSPFAHADSVDQAFCSTQRYEMVGENKDLDPFTGMPVHMVSMPSLAMLRAIKRRKREKEEERTRKIELEATGMSDGPEAHPGTDPRLSGGSAQHSRVTSPVGPSGPTTATFATVGLVVPFTESDKKPYRGLTPGGASADQQHSAIYRSATTSTSGTQRNRNPVEGEAAGDIVLPELGNGRATTNGSEPSAPATAAPARGHTGGTDASPLDSGSYGGHQAGGSGTATADREDPPPALEAISPRSQGSRESRSRSNSPVHAKKEGGITGPNSRGAPALKKADLKAQMDVLRSLWPSPQSTEQALREKYFLFPDGQQPAPEATVAVAKKIEKDRQEWHRQMLNTRTELTKTGQFKYTNLISQDPPPKMPPLFGATAPKGDIVSKVQAGVAITPQEVYERSTSLARVVGAEPNRPLTNRVVEL